MMNMDSYCDGLGGIGLLGSLVFLIALIAVIAVLVRWLNDQPHRFALRLERHDGALEVTRLRVARGELSIEAFNEIRRGLERQRFEGNRFEGNQFEDHA